MLLLRLHLLYLVCVYMYRDTYIHIYVCVYQRIQKLDPPMRPTHTTLAPNGLVDTPQIKVSLCDDQRLTYDLFANLSKKPQSRNITELIPEARDNIKSGPYRICSLYPCLGSGAWLLRSGQQEREGIGCCSHGRSGAHWAHLTHIGISSTGV